MYDIFIISDDQGEADGIGSRYFEIQNIDGATAEHSILGYQEDTSGWLKIKVRDIRQGRKIKSATAK